MIDAKVKALIAKGATDTALACCIQKAWTEQFHMDISMPAVKGMIMHYRAVHQGSGRKTRRKQKGGMAPVDYVMGQGTTDFVYGRFPVEIATTPQVISALDNQRFFESNGSRACNTTGGHAAPASSILGAQAQYGGGLFDSFGMGFAPASVPRNFIESGVGAIQGAPRGNPEASPVSPTVAMATYAPRAYAANQISSISSLDPTYKAY